MTYLFSAPSHYLNQCCFIINLTIKNKLRRNSTQNTSIRKCLWKCCLQNVCLIVQASLHQYVMTLWPYSWWHHPMETFSALLAICAGNSQVTGEFPAQRPVTRSFDVFFDLRLNKRFNKQSWGWWFEVPSCPLWCHCNVFWCFQGRVHSSGSPWWLSSSLTVSKN